MKCFHLEKAPGSLAKYQTTTRVFLFTMYGFVMYDEMRPNDDLIMQPQTTNVGRTRPEGAICGGVRFGVVGHGLETHSTDNTESWRY